VTPCISAVQHLRRLRGGAQSHLLRASDGAFYVTKFQNNPQHIRVLANEMLATRLGLALGLPMPTVEAIEVCDWLIDHTEDLRIDLAGRRIPCRSGRQLGSRYRDSQTAGLTLDYLPDPLLEKVLNMPTLPEFWCSISGLATAMGGRQSSGTKSHEASDTPQPSLTKDIASMPANGPSPTSR